MPHTHTAYREDNIAVWDIIHTSIHATEAFSWIKRCEKRPDGRADYIALTSHYLGDAKNEALLRNAADNKSSIHYMEARRTGLTRPGTFWSTKNAITISKQQEQRCLKMTRSAGS